uniref:Uncharacterized protein n=1 Tax=Anguilla anguilla TaxID=7936 RepID=A0A0E9XZ47_ANGAN
MLKLSWFFVFSQIHCTVCFRGHIKVQKNM